MTRVLLLLLMFFVFIPQTPALAFMDEEEEEPEFILDYTDQESGSVVINKNGQPMFVSEEDSDILLERMLNAFNSNKENSTHSIVLRQQLTRDGATIEQRWNELKEGHYFSARLDPPEELYEGSVVLDEIIVSISDDASKNPMGTLMAKLEDGEIRAYGIDNWYLIDLYCVDRAQKYLPESYHAYVEKFYAPEYQEQGFECSTK